MKHILCALIFSAFIFSANAQNKTGKIYDANTKEPLAGVYLKATNKVYITSSDGSYSIPKNIETIEVFYAGFITQKVTLSGDYQNIALQKSDNKLQEVVVSANRTAQLRSEAPIAITSINKQTIDDTKAQRIDQLINKVSGVFMVNLGNEQHEMSIRQPMTTKSLFLYLEDGVPIRTTGVYNHNALLEMNLPAAKSIEVIKGPSSALYGSEAIGGAVNVITQSAPAFTNGQLSVQLNNKGYKRTEGQVGTSFGKWGILVSGYYADKKNGPIEYSDFNKTAITLRTDFRASEKTNWANTLAYIDYFSDMSGSIDSLKFAQKNYTSQNTFTYRSVYALRYKSMLSHVWNSNSNTSVSLLFRNNSVKQNPSYSISSTTNPAKFKGQINENAFKTFALFVNHTQKINWLNSKISAGASTDFSPQSYYAKYISINKNLGTGKYESYSTGTVDSLLSKYQTGIINLASYLDYESHLSKKLKLVAALRYDAFQYYFINGLPTSSSVKTASTINKYSRFTPKIGLTYNYKDIGFYANYSEGYVPPQLTELYSAVSLAPYLLPQTFKNVELGGWASLLENKIYLDWSIYKLNGTNEIISVKQPDNSYLNQNSGSTKHLGIEYGITYKPITDLSIRFSGTNAKHTFIDNIVRGVNYSGREMSAAPRFTSNAELTYKPYYIKGLRFGLEWQHQGKYFMDDLDKFTYKGFDVVNLRLGYQVHKVEVWLNTLNATNVYYSTFSSKNATTSGNASYSYTLGDPREITFGLAYHFGKL